MKLNNIEAIARTYGIRANNLSDIELIKSIQASQGNFTCIATAYSGECNQEGCCWREDCFNAATQITK